MLRSVGGGRIEATYIDFEAVPGEFDPCSLQGLLPEGEEVEWYPSPDGTRIRAVIWGAMRFDEFSPARPLATAGKAPGNALERLAAGQPCTVPLLEKGLPLTGDVVEICFEDGHHYILTRKELG